ncbi:VOC family protein [Ruegeria sp. Ofav3-42]|uniref:VOC family protein n=1 Tax=Ruegeria sp. Ofav3-42 TaxID=2917759 RepID=UPI001EF6170B|nr:VOC family protein [Ruegeria sp. Ofav3-42]MCG7518775.1 VOC family protein [Ruegeria sp. Ofav3-42]
MTSPPVTRLILYAKDVEGMVRFYESHFGYKARQLVSDRIVELVPDGAGLRLMLHPASKAARQGQSAVKIVFDVADVAAFCTQAAQKGLQFGPIHKAEGYSFANAKDPSGNSISVSSRAFVTGI